MAQQHVEIGVEATAGLALKPGCGIAELVLVRLSTLKHADPSTVASQLPLVEQEGKQPVLERTPELTAVFEAVCARGRDFPLVKLSGCLDAPLRLVANSR